VRSRGQGHHRDGLVRFLIFRRCLQLLASEVEEHDVFLFTQIEIQDAPVDSDLARPDAEESAESITAA
jgi:hypothetical protein